MFLHIRFVCLVVCVAMLAAEKKPKDQGEYDLYNDVVKAAATPAKQIELLDTWSRKYPGTDYHDERSLLYLSAYSAANQPAKAVDTGAALLAKDLKTAFPDSRQVLTVLYLTALNIQKIADPSPAQVTAGSTAARMLREFTPGFFTAASRPAQTSEAEWAKARSDIEAVGGGADVYLALLPGNRALAANPKDPANCAAAEAAFRKAVEAHPENPQATSALASALRCQQSVSAGKVPLAIYHYARLASQQPDAAAYLKSIYVQYHGSEEGLDELKRIAASAPFPPAGFTIQNKAEIEAAKEAEIARRNPQLALWKGIRQQLEDPAYFEDKLKDAAVPKLRGTLVEARPACRARELTVAISDSTTPEVTLKLSAPLTGRAETGMEIQWEGVPAAFNRAPFMLTMTVGKAAVENLKVVPCAKK